MGAGATLEIVLISQKITSVVGPAKHLQYFRAWETPPFAIRRKREEGVLISGDKPCRVGANIMLPHGAIRVPPTQLRGFRLGLVDVLQALVRELILVLARRIRREKKSDCLFI